LHLIATLMKTYIFRCLLWSLVLLSFRAGMAQSAPAPKPQALTLNHIAMYVNNLEKATNFYEQVLQLKKIEEPFKDGRHTWFSLGAAGALHLIQGPELHIQRPKNEHLCFSVASIEAFMANLDKHQVNYTNLPGTAKAPTIRPDGVKQIYFQDPDGHWIEINNARQ
jgi:lactoylglutathione lyase